MAYIKANMEEMSKISKNINSDCQNYVDTIKELFDIIDDLKNRWKGEDNLAYTSKLEAQRPSVESIARVVNNYAQELQNAAADLFRAQSDIASSANG